MPATTETTYQIRRLLSMRGAASVLRRHRWSHEGDRWQELITALLCECLSLRPLEVSKLVRHMRILKLIQPETWLSDEEAVGEPSIADPASKLLEIFDEHGVSAKESKTGVDVIREAVEIVNTKYGGRSQKVLREAGQVLLDSLAHTFEIDSLPKSASKRAVALWLQNVLNLPVSLEAKSLKKFCAQSGNTPAELTAAADKANLNLAALDDLVEYWAENQKKKSEEKAG
jgi:hypothetical protein